MTQRSFLIWAHFLLFELPHYHREFPMDLANERFLLILDGHSSWYTFEAINLLFEHGVDVIALPSHYTHVLQPFDVSAATLPKTMMAALCQELRLTISLDGYGELTYSLSEPEWRADKRKTIFQAFLLGWDEAVYHCNTLAGFCNSGISPLNPK
jgi:hypothetical protein